MKTLLTLFSILIMVHHSASADEFKLPFNGTWFVMQGGDTLNVNHHMAVRAQWYGIDFMKVAGVSGQELNTGSGQSIVDFYSWDSEVLSPISGEVVSVVDGLPDNPIGTKDPKNPAGNHLVIMFSDKQYVFIGHLKSGTVTPKKGQTLKAGDLIGHCGNSGDSDFPHIHIHMQDTPEINKGNGLNIVFNAINVELNGKKFDGVDWPLIQGLFVSNKKIVEQ